jgi:hypothetical protein
VSDLAVLEDYRPHSVRDLSPAALEAALDSGDVIFGGPRGQNRWVARRLPAERAERLPCPHVGCGARPGERCRHAACPHDVRQEWAALGSAGVEWALNTETWSAELRAGVERLAWEQSPPAARRGGA